MASITEFEHLKIQLESIKSATNDFEEKYCIGKGGFGKVYKGEIDLSNGQRTVVALKRLNSELGQGDPEFWKEIMLLSLYKHENIVTLLGYCDDSGEKILAYEYASRKSLDLYLNDDKLTWILRLKICIGAARGLAYLHTPAQTQLRILHRDIKSANILLDENWNAKISDFGLSKFGPANQPYTYLVSNAVGTVGYCDPLYIESGLLTKESDVYSFGVVLFEVLCGRLCLSNNIEKQQPLIGLVRCCYEENNFNEIVYGNIKDSINPESLKVFTNIAYQCLESEREKRPLMTEIVGALESALMYQCPEEEEEEGNICGILHLKVLRTMGIRRSFNPFATTNHYLMLKLSKSRCPYTKSTKTIVKHNEVNPEWNEDFTLYVENLGDQYLEIYVKNVVSPEKHDEVGYVMQKLENLSPDIPHTGDLKIWDARYHCIGNLVVEMVYKPLTYCTNFKDITAMQKAPIGTPDGGGLLVVIIREATLFDKKYDADASVSLLFRGELRNTPTMTNKRFPKWEQEFTFMLEVPPTNEKLHLEVISNTWERQIHRKESLGFIDIRLASVVHKKRTIGRYSVKPSDFVNGDHVKNYLDVELQWRTSDKIITTGNGN